MPCLSTETTRDLTSFRILSGGDELSAEFTVQSMAISKNINKIPTAMIVLIDGNMSEEDFPSSNADELAPGAEIEVQLGYREELETVFKGIVIKHSIKSQDRNSSLLCIEAKDIAIKMTVGRKNKYFAEVSDSDIIEEVLGDYELTPEVEATTVVHKEMVQYYCSDWDFMVTRAEANGKLVFVDDGNIAIKEPTIGAAENEFIYGQGIVEFETEMDARDSFAGINARSWDYARQEVIESEGNDPGLDDQGNLSGSDLADVIGLEALPIQHTGFVDDAELQAWTDAKLLRSRLEKIKGRIRIFGDPHLKPGQIVDVAGLGDRFNGSVYITGVGHFYGTDATWFTDLYIGFCQKWLTEKYDDVEDKPAAGLLPSIKGLQIGLVSAIHDDPDGEDRIQVKLPIIDPENDGIWARISTLDAGENRGTFFRPELGDEVIVGFLNDDPRDAIILGMVHSSAKPAPETADEENKLKGFVTRSEMKLIFNDDEVSFTVETPAGNKIILSEDEESILVEDQTGNTITMSSDGISIESKGDIILKADGDIKLEGKNIESKASANFKAEGQAGMEVSSSATAILKGSLVQIN